MTTASALPKTAFWMSDQQDKAEIIRAIQLNWLGERKSADTYRQLAETEADPKRADVLKRMAEAEDRHAARWASKLAELGAAPPVEPSALARRMRRLVNRLAGPITTIRRMEAEEDRFTARYAQQHASAFAKDSGASEMLKDFAAEERAHARALNSMITPPGPQGKLDRILNREIWHGRGGGWIADAVYGANDGLGAVFGIISGVAGATQKNYNASHYILVAGLAGMIASALSMGAGAYLAVKSELEVNAAEMHHEEQEIADNPEEEEEELALFYQLQGFGVDDSRVMAAKMAQDPKQLLTALAQQELGLSQDRGRKPLVSAFSAMTSTAVGAFIPIIPFFFPLRLTTALITAAVVSLAAHFAVGAAKSIITIRSWWTSGLEMTIVGLLVGGVTYLLGLAFGSV
jgi:VIT1/CCC1 family predicted Fe2+/Mn2+ transporter/rubrerythrin